MAAASGSRWIVAFNAMTHGAFTGHGIGLASFGADYAPTITWLTSTTGTAERDPVIARIGASLSSNRFLVGWRMQTSGDFNLVVTDGAGNILEGPIREPAVTWEIATTPSGRVPTGRSPGSKAQRVDDAPPLQLRGTSRR
jgi:hypothetical protein